MVLDMAGPGRGCFRARQQVLSEIHDRNYGTVVVAEARAEPCDYLVRTVFQKKSVKDPKIPM